MNTDTRTLSNSALHERRKQVIRLWKAGHKVMKVVELSGLTWPTVRKVIDRYEAEGAASLKPKERGRASGDGRSLSVEQEANIRQLICDKRPEQLKMEFALWTRGAVQQLIGRECGIELKIRTVGNYLKRWGFSPQKPIRRAYEQKPEAGSRHGWTRSIRRLKLGPVPKTVKFNGVTRPQSSIPTCAAALMPQRAPLPLPMRLAAARNCR